MPNIVPTLLFSLSAAALFLPEPASAGDRQARLTHPGKKKITNLTWKREEEIEIESVANGKDVEVFAIVEGSYKRAEWSLLWGTKAVTTAGPEGEFKIRVPLTVMEQKLELLAVSPLGELEKEEVGIAFPNLDNFRREAAGLETEGKRYLLSAGLVASYLMFSDSRLTQASVSEFALSPKIGFSRQLFNPMWEVGGNFFYNALPFAVSIPNDSFRFLAWNLRAGFNIPKIPRLPPALRFGIQVGYYYVTMFVGSNTFGFRDMSGPQLYPTVRYTLPNGHLIAGYFKFSPVTNGLALLTLTNREIAAGVGYTFRMKDWPTGDHPITINFDYSNLSLLIQGVTLGASTFSLSASYGFSLADISGGRIKWE